MKNLSAYKNLQTCGIGASLSSQKFCTIPGDLVLKVTINREMKVRGGPVRREYSSSFDIENDFVLNSDTIAKLREEVNSKTS